MSEKDLEERFEECRKEMVGKLEGMTDRLKGIEDAIDSIPRDRHNQHHEYLDTILETAKLRRDFWRGVKIKVASGSILTILGTVCVVLITLAAYWFQGHTTGITEKSVVEAVGNIPK